MLTERGEEKRVKLIDGDALKERFEMLAYDDWNQGTGTTWARAFEESADVVECAPPIDAVEVVRCKDCRHFFRDDMGNVVVYRCELNHEDMRDDFYCADNERRDDE